MRVNINKTTSTPDDNYNTFIELYLMLGRLSFKDMMHKYKVVVDIEKVEE